MEDTDEWTPAGWRSHPAQQMPAYEDMDALAAAVSLLAAAPPLVSPAACRDLFLQIKVVSAGSAFLLQGGDCAENFSPHAGMLADVVADTLLDAARMLAPLPVIAVARLAGQFAKPRSATTETRDGLTLPAYRGDAINDFAFSPAARKADPRRMVAGYEQAAAIHGILKGRIFTCHEALLLPYEESLTRRDPESGAWYATSAHFLWLGARTQDINGAHVAYLRGIANPIGIKCAPWTDAGDLIRLLDTLDPGNVAGRITLIPRMGAATIDERLPLLIDAVRDSGRNVAWCCDPMHGNTIVTPGGMKTRRLEDIKAEIARYFAIHRAMGTHPGGVHLELAGYDVTECTGGIARIADGDLPTRYETRCDPRLNPAQAAEILALVGKMATYPDAALRPSVSVR